MVGVGFAVLHLPSHFLSFIQNAGLGHGHIHFYLLCPFPVNSEGKACFKSQRGLQRDHMALFWTRSVSSTRCLVMWDSPAP